MQGEGKLVYLWVCLGYKETSCHLSTYLGTGRQGSILSKRLHEFRQANKETSHD